MMTDGADSFSMDVTRRLTPDTRELWMPMADAFDREGPEAVQTYLDAAKAQLEADLERLFEQFEDA